MSSESLIETGMPWSGPWESPRITASSAARAARRASSAVTVRYELSCGSSRSIRGQVHLGDLDRRHLLAGDQRPYL